MRKRRAIIFDDDPAILKMLELFFTKRGYEVLSYQEPTLCDIYKGHAGSCSQEHRCADVLLTDFMMLNMNGIELIKGQSQRGCHLDIQNKAIITGSVEGDVISQIKEMGCAYFKKPFRLSDISKWLDACEQRMDLSEPLAEL